MKQGKKAVLFVGDINVDIIMGGLASLPVEDREITCESFDVLMGSSAVLAACAYSILGGRSVFLGLAGNDDYGDLMIRGLQDSGVDTRLVRRTNSVRTGVTVNLIHGRRRSQVTYPGTIAAFDGRDIQGGVLEGISHVHFAGPYLQTKLRPEITRLLDTARGLGLTTSLDTQWDPEEEWQYFSEWAPRLDVLLVNADEAVSITGTDTPEKACERLAALTPCPLVKAGRRGALVVEEGRVKAVPTYRAEVVDTTGAGDSFDAAFLYARLERDMSLLGAAKFGNAAGARCCAHRGGVSARSSCADVLAFMEREYEDV